MIGIGPYRDNSWEGGLETQGRRHSTAIRHNTANVTLAFVHTHIMIVTHVECRPLATFNDLLI